MSSVNFIRWGGLAAIASALLAVASFVLYTAIVGDDRLSEAATVPLSPEKRSPLLPTASARCCT
jgi:hypothetical protein